VADAHTSGNEGGARRRNVGLAAAFLVPVAVYLYTLSPAPAFEDAVEFALGAATLGVNHPSGYPLETLVGHLFTYVPAASPAWRANLSSAVAAAAACAFVFLLCWELLGDRTRPGPRLAGAWSAAALCAFGGTFWSQAVIAEVYALNALLLAAALWCGYRCRAGGDGRWLAAAAFVAGLAAANHLSSLLLTVPLLAYLGWRLRGRGAWVAALLFALGASLYLYLPLRAVREPMLNWGVPADAPRLLDHLFRREAGGVVWARYRHLGPHAVELGRQLFFQFGPAVGLLGVVGAALVWRRPYGRALAVLALAAGPGALLLVTGLLTPPQLEEIVVWYVPFFVLTALFVGAALGLGAARPPARLRAPATAVAALLPVLALTLNFHANDRRGQEFAAEHGRNLLRTFPYGAISAFPFHARLGMLEEAYQTFAERRRPDVLIIDPSRIVRCDVPAVRRAPSLTRDAGAAVAWWTLFMADLTARESGRPVFYPNDDPAAAGWGAEMQPFGLAFYNRPRDGPPARWPAPWGRYEYGGLRDVGADLASPRPACEPTSYRVFALYHILRAEAYFARGDDARALAAMAEAEPVFGRDVRTAWLAATVYHRNGYPGLALSLYQSVLPRVERYRTDLPLYRGEYVGLLNALALAYLETGDYAESRRYFAESLALTPGQADVEAYLSQLGADAPPAAAP
jgi:tetratricopeptide (TPR) repeat protein